jgi:Lrp/AsnC family leucine-responsive transcriptional regulator
MRRETFRTSEYPCVSLGITLRKHGVTEQTEGVGLRQKRITIDETDKAILRKLQVDSRTPLEVIAKELDIPKSTVHYRTKKMEEDQVIEGYHAKVSPEKLGKDYTTITFVRAKYGPKYNDSVGNILAQIPGVNAVYFIFGDYDFMVLTRSDSREDFLEKLEKMTNMKEIERTNTQVVAKTLREDQRLEI